MKSQLIGKAPDAGKDGRQRTRGLDGITDLVARGAPGKSGLHASGEGERVIAPEPW